VIEQGMAKAGNFFNNTVNNFEPEEEKMLDHYQSEHFRDNLHTSQLHETTRYQAHLGSNCNDLSVEHEDLFRSLDWAVPKKNWYDPAENKIEDLIRGKKMDLLKQYTDLPHQIAERELKEME
jgi:hypothetical protein